MTDKELLKGDKDQRAPLTWLFVLLILASTDLACRHFDTLQLSFQFASGVQFLGKELHLAERQLQSGLHRVWKMFQPVSEPKVIAPVSVAASAKPNFHLPVVHYYPPGKEPISEPAVSEPPTPSTDVPPPAVASTERPKDSELSPAERAARRKHLAQAINKGLRQVGAMLRQHPLRDNDF